MLNKGTKELARQMSLMVNTPKVQADIERVLNNLGAFKRDQSGNIVRVEALKPVKNNKRNL